MMDLPNIARFLDCSQYNRVKLEISGDGYEARAMTSDDYAVNDEWGETPLIALLRLDYELKKYKE
jgi:hypothetical protein